MHDIDINILNSIEDPLEHEEDLKLQIEDEMHDEIANEESELSPLLQKIKDQVPSLFKLVSFIGSKFSKEKIKQVDQVEGPETSKPKKKTKFKVIHLVFLLGFAFLLFEEEIVGTDEPAVVATDSEKKVPDTKTLPKVLPVEKKEVGTTADDPLLIGSAKPLVEDLDPTAVEVTPEPAKPSEDITDLFKDNTDIDSSNASNNSENVDDAIDSINAQADALEDNQLGDVVSDDTTNTVDTTSTDSLDLTGNTGDIDSEDDPVNSEVADIDVSIDEPSSKSDKRVEESKSIVESKIEDDVSDDFLVKDFDSGVDITKSIIADLQNKVDEKKNQDLVEKNTNYDLLDSINYELPGRGLVYNCIDGHWACVNIKSYSLCQNNYSYDLQNKKQVQCFPSSIYEGIVDCEDEQLNKVSNSADTKFCN